MRTSSGLDHDRLDGDNGWPGRGRGSIPANDHPGGGDLEPCHPHAANRNFNLHKRSVERVIGAMGARLDDALGNKEMAEIACISPYHFNHVFREVTGIPPVQFLYALRLEKAKHLLVTTDLNVTDICFEVGYNSLGSFTSRFHQLVGLSPNAFRAFAKDFSSFQMELVRGALSAMQKPTQAPTPLWGTILTPPDFDGLVFAGLFRRAIPESQPAACTLLIGPGPYRLAGAPNDRYYVFSVGIPWIADAWKLLTLDGIARGRSRAVRVKDSRVSGAVNITLSPKNVIHPPILAALPLLVVRRLARVGARLPAWCERALSM